MFEPKSAHFPGKYANLPHCICFAHVRASPPKWKFQRAPKGWKTQERGKHTVTPVCPRPVVCLEEETGTDQTNPTFGSLQNWFWRARSTACSHSPSKKNPTIRFAPPFTDSQSLFFALSMLFLPFFFSLSLCLRALKGVCLDRLFFLFHLVLVVVSMVSCGSSKYWNS